MDTRVSNKRLIYATTGYLTETQIREVIQDVLNQAEIKGEFYVNVVHYKGKMCKYAYVWASSEDMFNLLIKFDLENIVHINKVSKIESSNLTKSTPSTPSIPLISSTPLNKSNRFKLLDMTEEDDSVDIPIPTTEVVKKEIILHPVIYSNEKLKEIESFDPKYTDKSCIIQLKAGLFQIIDDDEDDQFRIHNVWYADKVPKYITTKHLLDALQKFITNPNKKGEIKYSKNKKILKYPHINMKDSPNGKRLWITFDPESHDGQAALFMCKQLVIKDGTFETKIYFNHFIKQPKNEDNSESD